MATTTTTKKKVAPIKKQVKEEKPVEEIIVEEEKEEVSQEIEEEVKEIEENTNSTVNFVQNSILFMARVKENAPKFKLPTISSKVGTIKKGTVLNIVFEFNSGTYHMYKTDKGYYVLSQHIEKV